MPKLYLAQASKEIEAASYAWPTKRGATNKPAEFARFNAASERLIDDVRSSHPLGNELVPDLTQVGVRLMFRTCYIAACVARRDDISQDELTTVMSRPESFDVLKKIQLTSPAVAQRVEEHTGLVPTDRGIARFRLDRWNFQDDHLVFADMDELIEKTKTNVQHAKTDGECPMHKVGLNHKVFSAIVHICNRDQKLFQKSLNS